MSRSLIGQLRLSGLVNVVCFQDLQQGQHCSGICSDCERDMGFDSEYLLKMLASATFSLLFESVKVQHFYFDRVPIYHNMFIGLEQIWLQVIVSTCNMKALYC